MTVTDFAAGSLLTGPPVPQDHRPFNDQVQNENSRSAT